MTFSVLRTGQSFFDPNSGESWIKAGPTTAVCVSGGDAFEGQAEEFHPNDVVEPEQSPC